MEFKLRVEDCPCCGGKMMKEAPYGVFPYCFEECQDAQMKNKGISLISDAKIDDDYICSDCKGKGKASFICALCEERQESDLIKESFGSPAEYLCEECYSTVSAKEWEKKTQELSESHRYDFD